MCIYCAEAVRGGSYAGGMQAPAPVPASPYAAAAQRAVSATPRYDLTVSEIVMMSQVLPVYANRAPDFVERFRNREFYGFRVDELRAIIKFIRDRLYMSRVGFHGLPAYGRKQVLIDGLHAYLCGIAKPCEAHPRNRESPSVIGTRFITVPNKTCTCYPIKSSNQIDATGEADILKQIQELPTFRVCGIFHQEPVVLALGFLRIHEVTKLSFNATTDMLSGIASGKKKVVLRRFCPTMNRYDKIDTRIVIRLNGVVVGVPRYIYENPLRPVDVEPVDLTSMVRNPIIQHLVMSSSVMTGIMVVQVVSVTSIEEIAEKIKGKGMLENQLVGSQSSGGPHSEDDDVCDSNMLVCLRCPLSMARMKVPVRSIHCKHLQCFDLEAMLMFGKQYRKWSCPVCKQPTNVETLRVDSFFAKVLAGAGPDIEQANIHVDGSIEYVDPEAEKKRQEAQLERLNKRRKIMAENGTQPLADDGSNDAVVLSDLADAAVIGSSFDCPVVLD
ncbi:unnamed protein product (mitochondrion) [Plasmodiophora brassicae]|uniref:SP-RING-type domain-containing protein n=1 Tax=Plasmodiophora brassicae TaxID=37360 RepID=A0A3P3YIS2_PLABS|nr:unnamed protein product [Plasmodiophora brassicae]